MCDPTDIPSVDTRDIEGEFTPAMLVKKDLFIKMYIADSQKIPPQLLTPPMSPVDKIESDGLFGCQTFSGPRRCVLLELPSPVLLLIISHLGLPEI
ncbi:hypothetical protein LPJ56_005735, partial [Coemansia sp. RSA 2599]